MTESLPNAVLQELAARLEFYRELGIYDFYRRDAAETASSISAATNMDIEVAQPPASAEVPVPAVATPASPNPLLEESNIPRRTLVSNQPVPALVSFGPVLPPAGRPAALAAISDLIGDCQRCRLAKGR